MRSPQSMRNRPVRREVPPTASSGILGLCNLHRQFRWRDCKVIRSLVEMTEMDAECEVRNTSESLCPTGCLTVGADLPCPTRDAEVHPRHERRPQEAPLAADR